MKCTQCSREIIEVTYRVNGGLCGPCKRGAIICARCGNTVFNHSKMGQPPYYCTPCTEKNKRTGRGLNWQSAADIDWHALECELLKAAATEIKKFAKQHRDEEFCAIGFCVMADGADVLISLDTLASKAERGAKASDTTSGSDMREWTYRNLEPDKWLAGKHREEFVQVYEGHDEEKDGNFDFEEKLVCMACRALARLELEGGLDAIRKSGDFLLVCGEHDSDWGENQKRMERIRRECGKE